MRPIFLALTLLFAGRLFAGPAVAESVKVNQEIGKLVPFREIGAIQ